MDIYEELAMLHLTRQKHIFLIPQYDLGGGWRCPDFVGIDITGKKLLVIEVTTAVDPKPLIAKIKDRENQWFEKLRDEFKLSTSTEIATWPFCIRVYVRDICKHKFSEFIENGVFELYTFESIGNVWNADWYLQYKSED